MPINLSRFRIEKLHGEFTYDIKIEDNKLVIVSENGVGKTTIVNAMYYVLSRQWKKLLGYSFESISLTINGRSISVARDEIYQNFRFERGNVSYRDIHRRLPLRYRRIIDEILENYYLPEIVNDKRKLAEISENYSVDINFLLEYLPDLMVSKSSDLFYKEFEERIDVIKQFAESQILYLPTYRRIEQDLSFIFPDLETNLDAFRNKRRAREREKLAYLELVEFGMEDVKGKIGERLKQLEYNLSFKLKNNLTGNYLKDIIRKKYKDYDIEQFRAINVVDLKDILARIDASILDDDEKEKLQNFVDQVQQKGQLDNDDKIVAHFISSLLEIYDNQKKEEEDVDLFVKICNEYMSSKMFIYNRNEPDIKIFLKKNDRPIELKNLSSGEKQIVSLFSHLYLSKEKNYFVIIDEPELSLSVLWQQKLLPDIANSNLCTGLIAVTHSPYIFKNEMKKYTHSLDEFLVN